MMSVAVDNFVCVRDPMEATEAFFASAAAACAQNLPRCYPREERFLLDYATHKVEELCTTLEKSRAHADGVLLSLWIQFTPDDPVPADGDLQRLRSSGYRPGTAADELIRFSLRWAAIFRGLSEHAPTAHAAELFEGYRCLLESWAEHLTRAWDERRWV